MSGTLVPFCPEVESCHDDGNMRSRRTGLWIRVSWALTSVGLMVIVVFALSATLPLALLRTLWNLPYSHEVVRTLVVMAIIPAYLLFAFTLMVLSAIWTRLAGWRTPADVTLEISSLDPRLLAWVRSMVMLHVVRVLAGSMFRASPMWSLYLRLNGARLGRRVFINSLAVTDHNLLEFGDDVIIGDGAHIAGHTIEDGLLKTARVRLGGGVTIGVGSVVGIGVDAGSGCRVGALSVVPKFTRLEAGATYVGAPVRKIGMETTVTLTETLARGNRPVPGNATREDENDSDVFSRRTSDFSGL
jgi:acetyltransferase-like isoleucine patch superfamily enzyme